MNFTKRLAALLVPCLLAIGSGAQAATGDMEPYVEGSYAWPKLDTSGFSATAGVGIVRAGVNFNRYVALEAVGAFGTSDANGGAYGIPIALKVKSAYGAYVKGQYPVAPHFELFARVGWLHATVEATDKYYGFTASSSDSSFSYGGGFQIPFGTGWYAQADYMSYYSKGGDAIRGTSIGIGYRFH
jgi:Outer membrane protein beta-barrel domain